jgi:hypothetical protein
MLMSNGLEKKEAGDNKPNDDIKINLSLNLELGGAVEMKLSLSIDTTWMMT